MEQETENQNTAFSDALLLLRKAYAAFNARDIDTALATMLEDVDWPNGMEGGIEHGHAAIRNYWTRQWTIINPHVYPLQFDPDPDGRIDVLVHQVVHDLEGKLLIDEEVHHIYLIEKGLIKNMKIKSGFSGFEDGQDESSKYEHLSGFKNQQEEGTKFEKS